MDKNIGLKLKLCRLRIKSIRESMKMSQEEFGKRIGISGPTLSRYESGKRIPDIDTLFKIADEFNAPVDWLCGNEDNTDDFLDLYLKLTEAEQKEIIKYMKYTIEKR